MIGDAHRLTPGYVARHVPPGSRLGINVAILDIAQDFLLAHLAEAGFFSDLVVFKGGTALRKFFAGNEGRFSTDLGLATRELDVDRHEVAGLIAEHAATTVGPFEFQPQESRKRWSIRVRSAFGDPAVTMKLDVGPPCWLTPEERSFVGRRPHRAACAPATVARRARSRPRRALRLAPQPHRRRSRLGRGTRWQQGGCHRRHPCTAGRSAPGRPSLLSRRRAPGGAECR